MEINAICFHHALIKPLVKAEFHHFHSPYPCISSNCFLPTV